MARRLQQILVRFDCGEATDTASSRRRDPIATLGNFWSARMRRVLSPTFSAGIEDRYDKHVRRPVLKWQLGRFQRFRK